MNIDKACAHWPDRNLIKCQQSSSCCSSSRGWHVYLQPHVAVPNSLQWNPWRLPQQSPECGRPLAQFSGRDLDHFGLWKESCRKVGHRATLPWPRCQHKIQCIPSWPQSLGPCKKEFHRRLWVSFREARWWKSQSQWSSPWWTNGSSSFLHLHLPSTHWNCLYTNTPKQICFCTQNAQNRCSAETSLHVSDLGVGVETLSTEWQFHVHQEVDSPTSRHDGQYGGRGDIWCPDTPGIKHPLWWQP